MTVEDRKEDKQREIEGIGLNYLSVPNHMTFDKQILTGVSYVHGIGADSLRKIHVSIQTFRLPSEYDHPSHRDKVGRRPLGLTQGTILRYLNPAPRVSGGPGLVGTRRHSYPYMHRGGAVNDMAGYTGHGYQA